jgi:hypothetical protein
MSALSVLVASAELIPDFKGHYLFGDFIPLLQL